MREPYFDNAKAILIILVVIGHLIELLPMDNILVLRGLWILIYSFHMPAFVFISGYFAKKSKSNKVLYKYVGLYILTTFLFLPFHSFEFVISLIKPFWLLWYLICLIYWYVFAKFLKRFPPNIVIPISLTLGILIGYYDTGYVLALPKMVTLFPFFMLGYYCDKLKLEKIKAAFRNKVPLLVTSILIVTMTLTASDINRRLLLASSTYSSNGYGMWYSGVINVALYGLNFIAMFCFFALVPNKYKFWTFIGKYTLPIYIIHGFIIQVVKYLL